MKILYGVQGTGNGHLTRARAMQKALLAQGIEVDWVFSGRPREEYFGMEVFGDYQCFQGLSFSIKAGQVDPIKTVSQASFTKLLKDVQALKPEQYDLVISDFEPVVAWAAKVKKVSCIGLGHQYAFLHDIPKTKNAFASYAIMKWFAPVSEAIGVHWHHFNQPILPPIIEQQSFSTINASSSKVALVYLPFESTTEVIKTLNKLPFRFIVHARDIDGGFYGNVHVKGFSVTGFKDSLQACDSVICNAGFELASECIHLGKRLLVKPLAGQVEQLSNAEALKTLGWGDVTDHIDAKSICYFLTTAKATQVRYPDVPKLLASWIKQYPRVELRDIVETAWSEVDINSQLESTSSPKGVMEWGR